jgi:hypothetical protein
MEVVTQALPKSGDCSIFLAGDFHYGALTCSRSSIKQMVTAIAAEKDALLILMGDLIEAITPDDRRWQTTSVDWQSKLYTPGEQAAAIIRDLAALKGRIPVVLAGNHEWRLMNVECFPQTIATALGSEYGGSSAVVHFEWEKKTAFRVHVSHGGWTPNSNAKDVVQQDANMRATLKMKLQDQVGDCIAHFCGHGHRLMLQPPTAHRQLYITTTKAGKINQNYKVSAVQSANYLHPDTRWFGMCGSFLKLYSPPGSKSIGYAEMFGYRPTEIGCLKATVKGGQLVDVQKLVY